MLISDISDLSLKIAKKVGVNFIVNKKNKDFGESIVGAFDSDKAEIIYDCVGNDISMGQAIKYARK